MDVPSAWTYPDIYLLGTGASGVPGLWRNTPLRFLSMNLDAGLTLDEARRIATPLPSCQRYSAREVRWHAKQSSDFVESKEEDPGGERVPVVVPTLRLPDKVAPLVSSLNLIAQEAEGIAVLRPVLAFWQLHRIRPRF